MGTGYESRPQQVEMANAVMGAMNTKQGLVIEAGTGVGKSLGYLLPAAKWVMANPHKIVYDPLKDKEDKVPTTVIVATYSKTLQRQLIDKDLPMVELMFPQIRHAVMFGRENYLSPERMETAAAALNLFGDDKLEELRRMDALLKRGIGCQEYFDFQPSHELWPQINCHKDVCGKGCMIECPYKAAKLKARNANILVVNHSMLMADLASGGWVLPGRDITIVDEAHRLEDAASTFFSVDVSTTRLSRLAGVALKAAQGTDDKNGARIRDLSTRAFSKLSDAIRSTAQELAGRFESARAKKPSRFDDVGIKLLEEVAAIAKQAIGKPGDPNADMIPLLAAACKEVADDIKHWHEQSLEKFAYQVARKNDSKWAALKASPIDVSEILKKELFDKGTVICTSATLAVGGKLDHSKKRIGAVNAMDVTLTSPFDYKKNCVAYFADDLPEQVGSNPSEAVFKQIVDRISDLIGISEGRALVLFTSKFQMTKAADLLRREHPKLNIIMQYDGMQRSDLIKTLKENPKTVLLGVDTMGEGVDVPGDALVMVIITKIPFANPKDPLVEAKCEDIEKNGGSSFGEFMLPNAAMKMKQWFGRLIRTSTDWGCVAILDCRLTKKQYGRFFLQSLPNARGTKDIEVVRQIFKEREAVRTP